MSLHEHHGDPDGEPDLGLVGRILEWMMIPEEEEVSQ
jgi:hypothetical protein